MTTGRHVVWETADQPMAGLFVSVLEEEGLDPLLEGPSAALVGVAPHILPYRVTVPAEHAARAAELLRATQEHRPEPEEPDPDVPKDPRVARAQRVHAVVAAGLAFVFPGGCHFFVRRTWTGFLFVGAWLSIFALLADRHLAAAGAAAALPLFAADLAGGLWALRAERRGRTASPAGQLARGLGLIGVVAVIAAAAVVVPAFPEWRTRRSLSEVAVSCSTAGLSFHNQSAEAKALLVDDPHLSFGRVRVALRVGEPPEERVSLEPQRIGINVGPGQTTSARFDDAKDNLCPMEGGLLLTAVNAWAGDVPAGCSIHFRVEGIPYACERPTRPGVEAPAHPL